MNKVLVTGNLVQQPEVRLTPNGSSVLQNTIAVKRDRKNDKGEYETDFINFVAWNHDADFIKKYANKGDRLELVGRWQVRKYEVKNETKTVNELIVESVSVISKKEKEDEEKVTYADAMKNAFEKDDLPF